MAQRRNRHSGTLQTQTFHDRQPGRPCFGDHMTQGTPIINRQLAAVNRRTHSICNACGRLCGRGRGFKRQGTLSRNIKRIGYGLIDPTSSKNPRNSCIRLGRGFWTWRCCGGGKEGRSRTIYTSSSVSSSRLLRWRPRRRPPSFGGAIPFFASKIDRRES